MCFFFQDEGHTFFVSTWSITANGKQPRFIRAICICILGTSEALDKSLLQKTSVDKVAFAGEQWSTIKMAAVNPDLCFQGIVKEFKTEII